MASVPHTLVFSDIHLTTAEVQDPERPLWMRYKHRDLFVDDAIARMLEHVRGEVDGPLEVILNGDVFDFDACTQLPEAPEFEIGWMERHRGLNPTEVKSAWKMERILDDHPVFVDALRAVLREGHRVVFTVGNHDIELHWPAVQDVIRSRLDVGSGEVLVCEWFYVSNGDTLVEHGNQYDTYCLCLDPISPMIRVPPKGEPRIRLPFGNYAARYMLNGMGMINPYRDQAYIMPFWGWFLFFYRHVARVQPLLAVTWIWTAFATFLASLRDGVLPAEKDVVHLEERVEAIAARANATPRVVRALDALKVHPAIYYPWKIFRELWLDRLLLIVLLVIGSLQIATTLYALVGVSLWWWFVLLAVLLPPFFFYARQVSSDAHNLDREIRGRAELIQRVTGLDRIVLGHSHREVHTRIDGVELLNAGTWSPSFKDIQCTEPAGLKCVVRLWPRPDGSREATLEAWTDAGFLRLPFQSTLPATFLPRPRRVGLRRRATPATAARLRHAPAKTHDPAR